MKMMFGLVCSCLLLAPAYGAPPSVRARVALALAAAQPTQPVKAECGCGCGCVNCTCAFPGECGSPFCTCGGMSLRQAALDMAFERAIQENKPVLVWVAMVCPPCEKVMPDYIHVHVTSFRKFTESCVLVGQPDGNGGIKHVVTFLGCPTAAEVSNVLAAKTSSVVSYIPPPIQQMAYSPMRSMPMMMGGGGGGGRGGC